MEHHGATLREDLGKKSPSDFESLRSWVKTRIRKYPAPLYRGSRAWEREDLQGLAEEFFHQIRPTIEFMKFSGAPPQNIFRTIRLELSSFMIDHAPPSTRAFINQVSGILKPKYGFIRHRKKGIGFSNWIEQDPVTPFSRNELMGLWKDRIPFPANTPGFALKAKNRRLVFRLMVENARGWIPKNWFYNGFIELAGFSFEHQPLDTGGENRFLDSKRPGTYDDYEKIRELKILHGEAWMEVLNKALEACPGKARTILFRVLLYEDSQAKAARAAGTEPQYAFTILKRIRREFLAVLPLDSLEMAAFKSFFQEYLFRLEGLEGRTTYDV